MAGTLSEDEDISSTASHRPLLSPVSVTTSASFEKYAPLDDSVVTFEQLAAAALPESGRQSALDLDLYDEGSMSESRFLRIASSMRDWLRARSEVDRLTGIYNSEEAAQQRSDYSAGLVYAGHEQDDDQPGQEQDRMSLATYIDTFVTPERNLKTALQELLGFTDELSALLPTIIWATKSGQYLRRQEKEIAVSLLDQESLVNQLDLQESSATSNLNARTRNLALAALGPGWVGYWTLGQGGFGRADCYVKQDSNGIIVDRAVVKNSFFRGKENMWDDANLWSNGRPNDQGSVPNEVQAMYNLRGKVGSSSILHIRNWSINRPLLSYTTYTEFCPGGELFDLIKDSSIYGAYAARWEPDTTTNCLTRDPPPPMIPEPFIWWIFECLATAGVLMERGDLDKDSINPWNLIVHRDLKLPNVFLGMPHENKFQGYPEPKLGDFGLAILFDANDTRVPTDIQVHATFGTASPEQHTWLKTPDRTALVPLSSKSNVYGIGITIWALMSCIDHLDYPQGEDYDIQPDDDQATQDEKARRWLTDYPWKLPPLDATAKNFYSLRLRKLVYSCCRFRDTDRPSIDQILRRIKQYTRGPGDLAQGLRTASADDDKFQNEHKIDLGGAFCSKWKLGMTLSTTPDGLDEIPSPPGSVDSDPSTDGDEDDDPRQGPPSSSDDDGGRARRRKRRRSAGQGIARKRARYNSSVSVTDGASRPTTPSSSIPRRQ